MHRIEQDDTLIGLLPFFHIYGQTVVLNLGLAPRRDDRRSMPRFDMGEFLDLLERAPGDARAHRAAGRARAREGAGRRGPRPRAARRDLRRRAARRATRAERAGERLGAPVRQGYGMTEASPVTHFAADDELADAGPGRDRAPGAGAPRRGSSTRRRGEDTDGAGEIWIRGPQVMRGYLADDAATAATLTEDGWLQDGRRRARRRRGRVPDRRPRQGADQVQGLPGAAGRARGAAARPPGGRGRRGDPVPDADGEEVPEGLRRRRGRRSTPTS